MEREYLKSLLKILGISDSQFKAYLTLVERGPLTARDIVKYANIPSSKVYSLLRGLVKAGLIEVDNSVRPEVFRARPPREVFNMVMARINDLANRVRPIVEALQVMYNTVNRNSLGVASDTLVTTRGIQGAKNLARIIIFGNSPEVNVAIPYVDLLDDDVKSMIIEASESTEFKLLVTSDLADLVNDMPPRVTVRVRDRMFGAGFIGSGVLLTVKYGGDYVSLYSTQDYIKDIAKTYFDKLWVDSKPLKAS